MNGLYTRPDEYDREHLGDDEDTGFYLSLVRRLRPRSILELGCGTGRVTIPLAQLAVTEGYRVVGLDSEPSMLRGAFEHARAARLEGCASPDFIQGDLRSWAAPEPFDLIIAPCSSLGHLHQLEEQIATWRRAYDNLACGGRFVVEVTMPNLAVFADSLRVPPRELIEVDVDNQDDSDGVRLVRRKTTRYLGDQQRAQIRFMYEKYREGRQVEGYVDDFASHVFFPRELQLLFIHAGFEIEELIGDYRGRTLSPTSQVIIAIGRRA